MPSPNITYFGDRIVANVAATAYTPSDGLPKMIPLNSDGTAIAASSVPSAGAFTDRSGSITTGGTAQQLAASNSSRKYLFIQNNSDGDLWVNFGVTAVASQPSIKIEKGANFFWECAFVPNTSVSVIGATTGQTFTAKEA